MAFVTDASLAARWVLPHEESALADLALDRLVTETATVPGLFWHEMRNLLLSAERRGRIDIRHVDRSMERLRRLRIRSTEDTDDRDVLELARAYRLTAHDSSYLARAIRAGGALASLDRRLNEAAAAEGVTPFA